ncbi:MAG: hypothetical protein OH316_00455 [Candidatus Parvarchaeota archaeon]|nr:hypothetical protein [Candidatus Parvarchaeota archaeon]MCW1301598.1 hypothetical protein [Candidatus Parvarchaeota archaeon]
MDNSDLEAEQYLQNLILSKNVKVEDNRLLLLGRPGIMMNAEFIVSFSKYLADYNKDLVIKLGKQLGTSIAKDYKARFNDPNKMMSFLSSITPLVGIGKIKIDVEKAQIITSISPSVLAETYVKLFGLSKEPACYFTFGLINELLETIFEKKFNTSEIECVAAGNNMCKFLTTEDR